jgi:hypothetical protein
MPDKTNPYINYLLQAAKAFADYIGFVGILTTALIQINPAIINHLALPQVLWIFVSVLVFGALKGGALHIADPNLRAAFLAVLEAIQQNFPVKDDGGPPTRRVPAVPPDSPDNYRH